MYERDLAYKQYEYPLNLIESTYVIVYGKAFPYEQYGCPPSLIESIHNNSSSRNTVKKLAENIDNAFEQMLLGEKDIEPKIRALKLRYADKMTLGDIAKDLSLSKERVRQILHAAQHKLRNPVYSNIVFAGM